MAYSITFIKVPVYPNTMPNQFPQPIPHQKAAKKPSLFKPKQAQPLVDAGLREEMNSLSTRLRVSEERYSDLRRKLQLVEQNMLRNHKRAMSEAKTLLSDIIELRAAIETAENRISLAIKELQLTAKKEDVDVVRKYIEMWNPVKFITVNQAEKMIKEALQEKKEEEKSA